MRVFLAVSLFILIACNSDKKKEDVNVAGAWKMLLQNLKSDSTDTTYTTLQQLKILTGDHMFYANINAPDSISNFGVGSYTVQGDTITENVIYSSSDTSFDAGSHTYKLGIEKTAKGYKQVIPDIVGGEVHYKLTEEYENAGTETKTPLDGLWKQVKAVSINGKDTTIQKVTQFKAYYAGNVIWGLTSTDSLKKTHTGIGFGKFEMTGNNKAKEKMSHSTFSDVRGHDFDVDISMNGSDEFTQTVMFPDGSKLIETYSRVKK